MYASSGVDDFGWLIPNRRWVVATLVGCGTCQCFVMMMKMVKVRSMRRLRGTTLGTTAAVRSDAPTQLKSGGGAGTECSDLSFFVLCNHVADHALSESPDDEVRSQMGTVAMIRRWTAALQRACGCRHQQQSDETPINQFPGTFHAFEDDIRSFLATHAASIGGSLTTPCLGGAQGAAVSMKEVLPLPIVQDIAYYCLLLIARRDCLVEFHVGVNALKDAKYCVENAVDRWDNVHECLNGGALAGSSRTAVAPWACQDGGHRTHSPPLHPILYESLSRCADIWMMQQQQYTAFTSELHSLQWRGVRSLLRHVLVSSPTKWCVLSLSTASSIAVGKLSVSGVWIRRRVEAQLVVVASSAASQSEAGAASGVCWKYVGCLILWESLRLVALRLVKATTDKVISSWSAQERETLRQELYRCLVSQPLSYFDMYHPDEIEEVMFYVNDIEGVDVHVHTTLLRLQQSMICLLQVAGETSMVTVAAAGAGTAIQAIASGASALLRRQWAATSKAVSGWAVCGGSTSISSTAPQHANNSDEDMDDEEDDRDLEELENAPSGTASAFISGGDILMDVHRLRPYGADHALMEAWCRRMEDAAAAKRRHLFSASTGPHHARTEPATSTPGFIEPAVGWASWLLLRTTESMPDAVDAWLATIPVLVRWMTPIALPLVLRVAAAAAQQHAMASRILERSGGIPGLPTAAVIMETMQYVEEVIASVRDIPRVYDLIMRNGHKALLLETLRAQAATETNSRRALTTDVVSSDEAQSDPPIVDMSLIESSNAVITAIHFNNVSFAYPTKYQHLHLMACPTASPNNAPLSTCAALSQLTVTLPQLEGHLVCITGPSGCGKSTMLSLLLALYRPGQPNVTMAGSVSLDVTASGDASTSASVMLDDVPHASLRGRLFGYVPQHPTIFAGTVAQNVAMVQSVAFGGSGRSPTSNLWKRVRSACQLAQCANVVAALPDGLLTFLTPSGSSGGGGGGSRVVLSGGQAQRIMIARALYQGCRILLMDEPTTALDADTKQSLIRDLKAILRTSAKDAEGAGSSAVRPPQTIIAVTHDDALIAMADVVVVLPTL